MLVDTIVYISPLDIQRANIILTNNFTTITQLQRNIQAQAQFITSTPHIYNMPETVLVIGGTGAQGVPVVKGILLIVF
jgi:hypothetical protein